MTKTNSNKDKAWRNPWVFRGAAIGFLLFALIEIVKPWGTETPFRPSPEIYYFMILWIGLGIIAEFVFPWMRKIFRPQDVASK